MRYLKKIRQLLYRNVQQKIYKLAPKIPTYLCMEKSSVWEKTMPYHPSSSNEVENNITNAESINKNIYKIKMDIYFINIAIYKLK